MKKEIKKRVKTSSDNFMKQMSDNIEKYIEDLATSSSQMDEAIGALLSKSDSLTPEQHAELRKQLKIILKSELDFSRRIDASGERTKMIKKILGDI